MPLESITDFLARKQQALKEPKNATILEAIRHLPVRVGRADYGETVAFKADFTTEESDLIRTTALMLKPWRKGPFRLGNLLIDSEWQSQIKYAIIDKHLDIEGKRVIDVGCNNGYYMFRMLAKNPRHIVGFDPSALFRLQFEFLRHFFPDPRLHHEMLGFQHLEAYGERYETMLCMGVLYHHPDPLGVLAQLRSGLVPGGELILDTFYIEGDEHTALFPMERYSRISNVYFIPTVPTLMHWLQRSGFEAVTVIATRPTNQDEQRKTDWIDGGSLEDFLDPADRTRTVEGYPAPRRVYIKARRR